MDNRILFFDTTLRDGDQTPGVNFSIRQKAEIAGALERMGIDIIEAGFAAASSSDFEAIKTISSCVKNSVIASLSRACEKDIIASKEALSSAARPRIHVFIATSPLHMQYKLKLSEEDVLEAVASSVKMARNFCDDVEFSAEDATRSDPEFLYRVFESAVKNGASTINIPDTVGYIQPHAYSSLITSVRENVSGIDKAVLSVHCHNDLGLAVANSIAAINAGARQVEGSINGIGERAGNAALEEIAMILKVHEDAEKFTSRINTKDISKISRLVSGFAGIPIAPNKAVVGKNVFSHESGIHQHGVLENAATYQIMKPEDVGLSSNRIILGKLSGKHAFSAKAKELGYNLDAKALEKSFALFKSLAQKKNSVKEDEICALIESSIDAAILERGYSLAAFQIQSGSSIKSSAVITLTHNGENMMEAAIGDGPIDASFNAINRLVDIDVTLDAYNIKAATEGIDALGVVTVRIIRNGHTYTGRGVSMDIIEASIKAYINGINKAIYMSRYVEESEADEDEKS